MKKEVKTGTFLGRELSNAGRGLPSLTLDVDLPGWPFNLGPDRLS